MKPTVGLLHYLIKLILYYNEKNIIPHYYNDSQQWFNGPESRIWY